MVASSTVAPPTTTVYVGGEQPEPTQTQGWSDGENGETGENGENGSGGPCFDGDQPCEVYLDAIDDCNGTWPQNTDSLASCQCGANHLWLNSVICIVSEANSSALPASVQTAESATSPPKVHQTAPASTPPPPPAPLPVDLFSVSLLNNKY